MVLYNHGGAEWHEHMGHRWWAIRSLGLVSILAAASFPLVSVASSSGDGEVENCSSEGGCWEQANRDFMQYAEFHNDAVQRSRNKGMGKPDPKVILCQPMYGLGNRVRCMLLSQPSTTTSW